MAFAMAINNLIEAMSKPGCPACRISRQASERALESFLWENVNEPDVRQGILDSYGFCPAHTRVMVAREVFTSSIPLGTNIIYEHLGRVVAREIKTHRPGNPLANINRMGGGISNLMRRLGMRISTGGALHQRGKCPACLAGDNAALNSLHVLCEEIPKRGDVCDKYLISDGLCLFHLRLVIENHTSRFPLSVVLLIDESTRRLERQSINMKEFIRKNNWAYRDEKLTEEEDTAWRKTLTFFTGLPGSAFTHKTEDY